MKTKCKFVSKMFIGAENKILRKKNFDDEMFFLWLTIL